jgi:hypothetical protein
LSTLVTNQLQQVEKGFWDDHSNFLLDFREGVRNPFELFYFVFHPVD